MNRVRQTGWVLASRIAPQASGVILMIIGARFLAPESLGSFLLIFAGIEFLRRLVRAGWREAIVVNGAASDVTAVVMTFAVVGALLAQTVALLAAFGIWRWIGPEPRLALCIVLLAATLLPLAPTVVWEGVLLSRQQPGREAKPLIVAEVVHLILAFLLLSADFGILGLACARVMRALVLSIGLARAARLPFSMGWDRRLATAVLPISANVTASSLINFATTYGVDFIVAFYLGPASVAFFRIGSRMAGALSEVVNETIRVLAWSTLPGQAKGGTEDRAAVIRSIDAFFDHALVLVAPVFVGLALISEPLVLLLMGETWHSSARIVALMAMARMLQVPVTVAWPALAIVGKTRYLPRLTGAIAGSAILLILIMGPYGIQAIAWSQVLASLLSGGAAMVVINRTVFRGSQLTFRLDTLGGLALMTGAVFCVRYLIRDFEEAAYFLPLSLALQVVAGGFVYVAFLWWRRRGLWLTLRSGLLIR